MAPVEWETPFLADKFPPRCPQKKFDLGDTTFTYDGQEDCLYLNVWSPDTSASLPVMVFIHGGGNQQGSSSEEVAGLVLYHGKKLSERGQVVVVTIQYRLGPLGYLVHPGLELENAESVSGNYGVMDQIFALRWIQDHISRFGGDASNVTIFGESAGGVNVGNLMTSPAAKGLFHKAIIQSGTPLLNDYGTATQEGVEFVDSYIPEGTDAEKMAFMRSVDPDSLIRDLEPPTGGGKVQLAWQPAVDGQLFTDHPPEVLKSGEFNRVPLMVGSNADEMRPQVPPTVYPFMVSALIDTLIPEEYREEARTIYPPGSTNEQARDSYADILTDAQFTASARRTAQCVSLNQSEPVWRYFFTHTHSPTIPIVGEWGAYHGIELLYLFNNWEESLLAFGPWFTPQDESIQRYMLSYWTNFAYTGDPNGTDLADWPSYDASADCFLEIRATPDGTQCGLRTAGSDLWDKVSGFTVCSDATGLKITGDRMGTITLYPNPAEEFVYLNLPVGADMKEFCVTVYDLRGRPVLSIRNRTELDISHLDPGLYLFRVESDGKAEGFVLLKGKP